MTTTPQTHLTLLAPVFPHVSQAPAVQWTDGHSIQPWQAQLVQSIGLCNWDAQHLPAAELIRASSAEQASGTLLPLDSALVCADPIHLRVDRDSATLIPAEMLKLSDSEADALLDSINDFLEPDRLYVSRTKSGQWLMSGRDGSELSSYPPSFLAHRNASAFLSDDQASGGWRRLMTELQMLLHTHPVNSEREQQGRMSVNSVWFWGGAALPSGEPAAGIWQQSIRLFADDSFTVALANHLDLDCEPLSAFDPGSDHPHSLIVDTRLTQAMFTGDEAAMDEAEHRIVDQWIAPIRARIEAGENIELDICNEDGLHGRMDGSTVQAAADEARAARISQMSVTARLGDRLVGGADLLWSRVRRTMSGRS